MTTFTPSSRPPRPYTPTFEPFGGLLEYARQAIGSQDEGVADQLQAALDEGRVTFRFTEVDGIPHAVVTVAGHALAQVDIRNIVPLDDL
jgi:hypothetical protein